MNIETIHAESEDISSYVKSSFKHKLKNGLITVTATIIIALSAFQQVSAQSNPGTKSAAQEIAQKMISQEFNSRDIEDQQIIIGQMIAGLSDKIQQQFADHLKNKEFVTAEKDIEFYTVVAKKTRDKNMTNLVNRLKSDLENEKKTFEQTNKDVHDQVRNNRVGDGSIQYIYGSKYATFTESSKDSGIAETKANSGLNNYVRKNNLEIEQLQVGKKIEQQGKIFVVTTYVLLNN